MSVISCKSEQIVGPKTCLYLILPYMKQVKQVIFNLHHLLSDLEIPCTLCRKYRKKKTECLCKKIAFSAFAYFMYLDVLWGFFW